MKNICNWCFKTMKECDCMFTKVEPTTADEYKQEWLEESKIAPVIVWMFLGFICGVIWMLILWGLTGWK